MMSPDEARATLNVSTGATPAEIERRYRALYSDCQLAVTQAPTPAIRRTYERRLVELEDARRVLAAEPPASDAWLPAAVPMAPRAADAPAPDDDARALPSADETSPSDLRARAFIARYLPPGIPTVEALLAQEPRFVPDHDRFKGCVADFELLVSIAAEESALALLGVAMMEASDLLIAYVAGADEGGQMIPQNRRLAPLIRFYEADAKEVVELCGGSGHDALKRLQSIALLFESFTTLWDDTEAAWASRDVEPNVTVPKPAPGSLLHIAEFTLGRGRVAILSPEQWQREPGLTSMDGRLHTFASADEATKYAESHGWSVQGATRPAIDLNEVARWVRSHKVIRANLQLLRTAWRFLATRGFAEDARDGRASVQALATKVEALRDATPDATVGPTPSDTLTGSESASLAQLLGDAVAALWETLPDANRLCGCAGCTGFAVLGIPWCMNCDDGMFTTFCATCGTPVSGLPNGQLCKGCANPNADAREKLVVESCRLGGRTLYFLNAWTKSDPFLDDGKSLRMFQSAEAARAAGVSTRAVVSMPRHGVADLDAAARWYNAYRTAPVNGSMLHAAWSFLGRAAVVEHPLDAHGPIDHLVLQLTSPAPALDERARGLLSEILKSGIGTFWAALPERARLCSCRCGPGRCTDRAYPGRGICPYCDNAPSHAHCRGCGSALAETARPWSRCRWCAAAATVTG